MPTSKAFINALLRQKVLILGTIAIFVMVGMTSFKYVTKKYKVQTAISIQTQYFQVPMIRDFMPETFDGGELRSQREALLRRSLNHKFLRELGKKHKLFRQVNDEQISTADLDELSKRFEIIPAGSTSFMIGFFSSSAEGGYLVIKDVIARIRENMTQERRNTLLHLHDAIEERLQSLSFGKQVGSPTAMLSARPDLIKKEVERLEEEVRVLKNSYSEKHPKIADLNKKIEGFNKWLAVHPEMSAISKTRTANFSGDKVDEGSKELFKELLKKYHYLEVAIYLDEQNNETFLSILQEPYVPKSPMWPKRSIFLIWSVISGFLVGAIIAMLREVVPAKGREYWLSLLKPAKQA